MIDVGVNLTNTRFADDLENVLDRAKNKGLTNILVTGTSIASSQQAVKLCQKYPDFLTCTAGVHPHDADKVTTNFIDELTQLAQLDCVKVIGECGLDFNRNFSSQRQQITVFKQQIELATRLNMPLFLHQRDAFELWLELLTPYVNKIPAMVSHCFTGNKQQLEQCINAGMYIGITGWVCDERRGLELQQLLQHIPLKRLLIETDAPYLLPRTIKPRPKNNRNEPSFLEYIVKTIVENTDHSISEIIKHTSQNAQQIFALSTLKETTENV
ncbi:MAG: hydrolase TatD [Gammaproteobacteria bacterium]|nr:MAG: hydrolase TatD [Gammaproteobacteria bacterium]